MNHWSDIVERMFKLLVGLIVLILLIGWVMSLTGCEKGNEYVTEEKLSLLALVAIQDPDSYHFICNCDNFVNSPRVYFKTGRNWKDIDSDEGRERFAWIRYRIWNSEIDTSWIQTQADPKWGRMTFCASKEGFEQGLCDFIQPCAVYTFNFKAEAGSSDISANGTITSKAIAHKGVTTRVYPSETIPNQSCP